MEYLRAFGIALIVMVGVFGYPYFVHMLDGLSVGWDREGLFVKVKRRAAKPPVVD